MTAPSEGKLLYHITHLNNMASILERGLLPRKILEDESNHSFMDIADPEILSKRKTYKDNLAKYVLFHFYARNPFDYAVCNKYGAENLAIITVKRELYKKNNFMIIPSHPLDINEPDIFPYEEGFSKIRWDILDSPTGRDYSNPDIRKACMAECIMEYRVQPTAFSYIYVYDEEAFQRINLLPNPHGVKIEISPNMFPARR
jgi:hypothetical protein